MLQNRADQLNGVTERRSIALDDFELREDGDTLHFTGRPSLFDTPYEMYGGPDKGGWIERVNKTAFARTLGAKPDVVLNMNHGQAGTGLPMARTTSGTLKLRTDAKSLISEADLDLRDPDVQALKVKVDRGDLDQMSFAFRTLGQVWNEDETERELTELSLDHGDVSIVTNGANPKTSFQLRDLDEALAYFAGIDPDAAVAEVRGWSADAKTFEDARAAQELLTKLLTRESTAPVPTVTRTLSVEKAKRLMLLDAR